MIRMSIILLSLLIAAGVGGCSRKFVGGAAVGAGAAGGVYEYQNKQALNELEEDFKAGRISKEEYLRRKEEIQKKSIVY